jgi:hypothetical protein
MRISQYQARRGGGIASTRCLKILNDVKDLWM